MAREYFCAYHSMIKPLQKISDAERGRLFMALLQHSAGETPINLQGREEIAFEIYADQIDRDREAYEARCETNRKNGANGTERPRTVPNAPQEKGKEKEEDKGKGKGKKETTLTGGKEKTPLDAALDDFAEFRKKIRKPLTDKARELTLAELEKLAPGDEKTQIAILNQSIQRGWQGVFALKTEQTAGKRMELPDYDSMEDLPC